MKVYQAVPNPYLDINQYVMTLMDGIDCVHNDVEWGWGLEKFWQNDIFDYDIIHIQWPDALLWFNRTPVQIERRLSKLKNAGKKIVTTCHNLEPHYCSDVNRKDAYNVVYAKSDMILHLGTYSFEVMKARLPNAMHVILPHHTYDSIYDNIPDRFTACKKMGLNPKYRYVICFGAFRDDEERLLVKDLAKKLKREGLYFIAPAYKGIVANGFIERVLRKIEKIKYHYYHHIIITGDATNPVSVAMTPYYYVVADIALIQRVKILNSGNLPMAFLMKKVVVGPNVGNVGIWLKESGNPTFETKDDAYNALKAAFDLAKSNYGEKNLQYALDNFATTIIAEQLYEYYLSLSADNE